MYRRLFSPSLLRPAARSQSTAYNLIEVGKLTPPKTTVNYNPGQLFVHSKLDYRGAILFPWVARVFNRENASFPTLFDAKLKKGEVEDIPDFTKDNYEIKIYYQVMIDDRDCPVITFQREGVTFLNHRSGSKFYTIPGIDYVRHAHVMPYDHSEHDKEPIDHKLFCKFFEQKADAGGKTRYSPTPVLHQFHEDNFNFLRLRDVHTQVTNNIQVTVYALYMGSKKESYGAEHWWRYTILIENLGDIAVQVRERTWCIFSKNDNKDSVTGRGIIGQEPILEQTQSFQYSSLISLRSDSGHMWGTYLFERSDGKFINVSIPPFLLLSQQPEESVVTV